MLYLKNGEHWLKDAMPEDNPNWKGGITPERQAFSHSEKWKKTVLQVWERDNSACQRCKKKQEKNNRKLSIHHIISFDIKELRAVLSNLVLLCHACHMWVHSKKNINQDFIIKELKWSKK